MNERLRKSVPAPYSADERGPGALGTHCELCYSVLRLQV